MSGATLVKTNFEECNMVNARLTSTDAQAAVFTRCRLMRSDFGSAHLQVWLAAMRCVASHRHLCCLRSQDANFTNADCTESNFQRISGFGVNFHAGAGD